MPKSVSEGERSHTLQVIVPESMVDQIDEVWEEAGYRSRSSFLYDVLAGVIAGKIRPVKSGTTAQLYDAVQRLQAS